MPRVLWLETECSCIVGCDFDGRLQRGYRPTGGSGHVDPARDLCQGPLEFNDPHGIDIDTDGNMYIADRGNDRVQVIDKDGNFKTQWLQFGKPSTVALDGKGNIFVADGMSDAHWNPGWERGIRIGDIKTGHLKAFIPDEEVGSGAGTEFLGVDINGVIYSGASGRPGLVVHELFRPLY